MIGIPVTPRDTAPLASEPTPEGAQTLVPGVRPSSTRARIEARRAAPLRPRIPQKPRDIGLGACPRAGHRMDPGDEDTRNQIDLS